MQTEWKNFSHLKRQHIFRNQLILNRKSEEDFDLEKAAANWARGGGQQLLAHQMNNKN